MDAASQGTAPLRGRCMQTSRFLVTGGSQGIGAAIVELARAAGHQVVFTGRNQALIDSVAKNTGAIGLRADVAVGDDNARTVDCCREQMGRVDVLMIPIDSQFHILKADQIAAIRGRVSPAVLIPMHYRHADLETSPDKPEQLGGIDEWAKRESGVRYLTSHRQNFSIGTLPRKPEVVIFKHSPLVKRPLDTMKK